MSTKASTVVVIDKKEYNLSGFEQEDYLQMVAAYINQKITEMNQQESYKRIPQDMKNLMLQLTGFGAVIENAFEETDDAPLRTLGAHHRRL